MTLLDRIKAAAAAFRQRPALATKAIRMEDLFGVDYQTKIRDVESYMRYSMSKIWPTWKACDLIGKAVMDTPYSLVRAGSNTKITVPGLSELLDPDTGYVNERDSFCDVLYMIPFHLIVAGDAFLYKSEARKDGTRPKELFLLNPARMRIHIDPMGRMLGYTYDSPKAGQIPIETQEIVRVRRPNPKSETYGLGDVEAGETLLNGFLWRGDWKAGFWKNGASPSGILFCEEVITDEAMWKRIKLQWQKEYGGSENTGKTAWLNGKWRYERLGLTSADMQDLEQTKQSVEDIFTLHGVPLSVAGVKDAANYATASIDEKRFKQWTVKPYVKMIQDAINIDLVAGYDANARLRFNIVGLINVEHEIQAMAPAFDRGWVSINECRERLGFDPDPDNELWAQHYVSGGLVPLEQAGVPATGGPADQAADEIVKRFQAGFGTNGGSKHLIHARR